MTLAEYLVTSTDTASSLARTIGVAHSTVLRWAYGSIEPSLRMLRRLHAATHGLVTPNDFLLPQASEPEPATTDMTPANTPAVLFDEAIREWLAQPANRRLLVAIAGYEDSASAIAAPGPLADSLEWPAGLTAGCLRDPGAMQ